jgi:prepilin-type processing-associated H-X9-DG protein
MGRSCVCGWLVCAAALLPLAARAAEEPREPEQVAQPAAAAQAPDAVMALARDIVAAAAARKYAPVVNRLYVSEGEPSDIEGELPEILTGWEQEEAAVALLGAWALLHQPPGAVITWGEPATEGGAQVWPGRKRYSETVWLVIHPRRPSWDVVATATVTAQAPACLTQPGTALDPAELVNAFDGAMAGRGALAGTALTGLQPLLTDDSEEVLEGLLSAQEDVPTRLVLALLAPLLADPGAKREIGQAKWVVDRWHVPVRTEHDMAVKLVLRRPAGLWRIDVPASGLATMGRKLDHEKALAEQSLSNLKQLALGVAQYAQDWDEVLPGVAQKGWEDQVKPYLRNEVYLSLGPRQHAYALNRAVAGQPLARIPAPAETVLLFETDEGTANATGGPELLPAKGWHDGRVAVAYVDGHAKLLEREAAAELLAAGGLADPPNPAAPAAAERLTRVARAILLWAEQNRKMLPPGRTWADSILPLLDGDRGALRLPEAGDAESAYAFNRMLAGVPLAAVVQPHNTVMVFECQAGEWNALGQADEVPERGWFDGKVHAAFVDGTVRLVEPRDLRRLLGGLR